MTTQTSDLGILALTRDLCTFATGVVAPDNVPFFDRLGQELPFVLHRYPSGSTYNGWVVPQSWSVLKATISKDGRVLFDGMAHPLAVGTYSRSFQGELELDELKTHLVTNPNLPQAYVYHCMWQYRPWAADWAMCVPHDIYRTFDPGRYQVDLKTAYEDGNMLVATYDHPGRSDKTIVFNAHTCHPGQANDDFAGVAVLLRLFQWLRSQDTYYTYRLVLGPEHLGTVFYLRERAPAELKNLVSGYFAEMPGTPGPVKIASSFLGNQIVDRAIRCAARHYSNGFEVVPFRQGAGNDETVWEAPGYEVPFVEVSRCRSFVHPFPEYHSSLDTADLMEEPLLDEFYHVLQHAVNIVERNSYIYRQFNGLICLSNPDYNLYLERPDPAVLKVLKADAEKWGHLLDCLFRYMDGSMTVLDIAEKHDLPFDRLYQYLARFKDKGLIRFDFAPIKRHPISTIVRGACVPAVLGGSFGRVG